MTCMYMYYIVQWKQLTNNVFVIFQLTPPPSYIQSRIELFDKLKTEYDTMIAGRDSTASLSSKKIIRDYMALIWPPLIVFIVTILFSFLLLLVCSFFSLSR